MSVATLRDCWRCVVLDPAPILRCPSSQVRLSLLGEDRRDGLEQEHPFVHLGPQPRSGQTRFVPPLGCFGQLSQARQKAA